MENIPKNVLIIKEVILVALLALGNILTIRAFSTRGKEGILLFFLGIMILTCTICIASIISLVRRTHNMTVRNMLIGLFIGGITGLLGIFKGIFFFLAYEAVGTTGVVVCGGLGALVGAFVGVVTHIRTRVDKGTT